MYLFPTIQDAHHDAELLLPPFSRTSFTANVSRLGPLDMHMNSSPFPPEERCIHPEIVPESPDRMKLMHPRTVEVPSSETGREAGSFRRRRRRLPVGGRD